MLVRPLPGDLGVQIEPHNHTLLTITRTCRHAAGFAVIFFMLPLQTLFGKAFSQLRGRATLLTDERVKKMNEVISGMRVVKMYAWEDAFAALVGKCRIQCPRFSALLFSTHLCL